MRPFPRRQHPGTAAILNLVIPGLGLAYLGRWGLAVLNVLLIFALSLAAGALLLFVSARFDLPSSSLLAFPFNVLNHYISGRWAMHEAIRMGFDDEPSPSAPPPEPTDDAP